MGNKRLFFLLFALIFFIAVMGLTRGNREEMTWPEKFLNDTVSWTQGIFYKPAGYVAGFFQDITHLYDLHVENEVMKKTLARYATDVARLNTLEQENARLQELLQFTERQKNWDQYKYRVAQVVAVSPDSTSQLIKIDLGSKDGIEEDWAVVTPQGLIGIVIRVSPFYSFVQPIIHMDEKALDSKGIAATVQGNTTESFGIIQGYNHANQVLLMTKISQDDPLKKGDVIITSGRGRIYPPGLIIGTVKQRDIGEGLTQVAEIIPAASIDNLREVFVVEAPEEVRR